ncbi:CAP domain-containing protein [Flavobacterium terrae]|uniref:Uncharacterized conserved protein YkwD, contains CAP (CSP/antigen 5/PR1) domain n=1 Tax=Flavobacterium terrae TaxID=415425 RepID=A0A1M6GYR7_9FLAO|nr:CAP domain-containing protein [Flavobacterium terrae]SHJ15083.1 Uncharacterized conserved protein YkwD, contains CAP (CSP/antigen 5/PR1) domain [Flavobacterium terrae]
MKKTFAKIALIGLLSISLFSCSKDSVSEEPKDTVSVNANYSYRTDEDEVLNLINNYREGKGLVKLQKIDYVSVKSEEHTNYMISTNSVNHNNFAERYSSIMSALSAKNVSENIAYKYSTSQSVVNAWLNSEGHRANIEGDFTHFGISIRTNSAGEKYYTNIFVKK